MIIEKTKKSLKKRKGKFEYILIHFNREMENIRESYYGDKREEKEKEALKYWAEQIVRV